MGLLMGALFGEGDKSVELVASIKATKKSKEKITVTSFLIKLIGPDQCSTDRG